MLFPKMASTTSPRDAPSKNVEISNVSRTSEKEKKIVSEENKIEFALPNLIYGIVLHSAAIYGLYLAFTSAKILTVILAFIVHLVASIGVTAGAHRLWSHRAYKATWQLRLLLMILNTMSTQGHVLAWARDHRTHHKYSDTNADPYSAERGFFFSHIGWLFCRKHPDVIEKGKGIDMSDLRADPILRFQKECYWPLLIIFSFIIPPAIAVYCWNESLTNAVFIATGLRTIMTLHTTFSVNSVAHYYGWKPYDSKIRPVENGFISFISFGEGWHNYHHTFPWDYKTSELGIDTTNVTTAFLNFFAWIGWAYDLKTISPDIIKKRVQRTGDGSHALWGWNDKNITEEDKQATVIVYKNKLEDD